MRNVCAIGVTAIVMVSVALAGECVCKTDKAHDGWCNECKVGYVDGVKITSHKLFDALQGKKVDFSQAKCGGCKGAATAAAAAKGTNAKTASGKAACQKGAQCQKGVAAKTAAGKAACQKGAQCQKGIAAKTAAGKAACQKGAQCQKGATACANCPHGNVTIANGMAFKSPVAATLASGMPMTKTLDQMKCPDCKAAAVAGKGWCDTCQKGIVGNRVFKDKKAYDAALASHELLVKAAKVATKCEDCAVAMVTNGTCTKCNVSFKDGKVAKATEKASAGG